VAVGGLIPVVEGIGREMARQRGMKSDGGIKTVFRDLFTQAKDDVVQRRIGATQEIVDMLDAFLHFLREYFFKDSQLYPLLDKTSAPKSPPRWSFGTNPRPEFVGSGLPPSRTIGPGCR
jgi:hypothetical protein